MAFDYLARVGAGVNPDSMHAERVDGYNPLAVADAIRRKRELIENGEGPILLETITYRYSGHSPSDASSYRIKEEIEAWQSFDPINAYAKELTDAGLLNSDAIDSRKTDIVSAMTKAFRLASDLQFLLAFPRKDCRQCSQVASVKAMILTASLNSPIMMITQGYRHWPKNPVPELLMVNRFQK